MPYELLLPKYDIANHYSNEIFNDSDLGFIVVLQCVLLGPRGPYIYVVYLLLSFNIQKLLKIFK